MHYEPSTGVTFVCQVKICYTYNLIQKASVTGWTGIHNYAGDGEGVLREVSRHF